MKKLFWLPFVALLFSCGDAGKENSGNLQQGDSAQLSEKPVKITVGKGAKWAFKPDSMINEMLIGDGAWMKQFVHDNGLNAHAFDSTHKIAYYLNTLETEQLAIVYLEKEKEQFLPYAFILTSMKEKKNLSPLAAPEMVTKRNFISSHGIYMGMEPERVKRIYTDQQLTQWFKNDTLYLHYEPSEKDAVHYSRFPYKAYSALYKFYDERLRVMEIRVNPELLL